MKPETDRAWKIAHVIALARFYQDELDNPTGGNLHIVLSDGNVGDSHVRFCLEEARSARDHVGVALAELLLDLTEEERERIYETLNTSRPRGGRRPSTDGGSKHGT